MRFWRSEAVYTDHDVGPRRGAVLALSSFSALLIHPSRQGSLPSALRHRASVARCPSAPSRRADVMASTVHGRTRDRPFRICRWH